MIILQRSEFANGLRPFSTNKQNLTKLPSAQTGWIEDGIDSESWHCICDGRIRGIPPPSAFSDYLADLTARASKKFSEPQKWVWSRKLLEQASDENSAQLMASAYPLDCRVLDLCCGAGADAVALANCRTVTAVDLSDHACLLARTNLALHRSGTDRESTATVLCQEAEVTQITADDWVHLDPDRRAQAVRRTNAMLLQPTWEICRRIIQSSAGGSVKLAPATRWLDLPDQDRSDMPLGFQFISCGRVVRQQRWWWNLDRYPTNSITLSMRTTSHSNSDWHHLRFPIEASPLFAKSNDRYMDDSIGAYETIVSNSARLGRFVGDADPVVRSACLQPALAHRFRLQLIGSSSGFFTSSAVNETSLPWIDWFEVVDIMPLDRKKIRAYLREREIGIVEIKTRDTDIVPETLRRELKLVKSKKSISLLVTKCGPKMIAILANRLSVACQERRADV